MNKEELYIITNESFNSENDFFFCDNIDLKSIPEELNKYCKVNIIGRKSKIKKSKIVKASTINIFGNIFSFLICVLNSVAKKKSELSYNFDITVYFFRKHNTKNLKSKTFYLFKK